MMNHVVIVETNSDATICVSCSCGATLANDLDDVYFDVLQILAVGHRAGPGSVLPTADTAARCEQAEKADVRERTIFGSGSGRMRVADDEQR